MPVTCIIQYEIDPFQKDAFEEYARNWNEAIPRCGAELIGYYSHMKGRLHWPMRHIILKISPHMKNIAPGLWPIRLGGQIMNSQEKNALFAARIEPFCVL